MLCQLCASSSRPHREAAPISWPSEHHHGNADLLQLLTLVCIMNTRRTQTRKTIFISVYLSPSALNTVPAEAHKRSSYQALCASPPVFYLRSRSSCSYCLLFLVTFHRAFKGCAMNSASPYKFAFPTPSTATDVPAEQPHFHPSQNLSKKSQ